MLLIEGRYAILVTGSSFTVNQGVRDITARETNNWQKSIPGIREWTMEFEGNLGWTYEDGLLISRYTAGGFVIPPRETQWILKEGYFEQKRMRISYVCLENGMVYWDGEAWLNGLNIDTPMEESSTISMSLTGSGRLKQETMSGIA